MSDGRLSIDPGPVGAGPSTNATSDPVTAVEPGQAQEMVQVDPAQAASLDAKVADYVAGLADLDAHDAGFAARVRDIQELGAADARAAAEVSNRLLKKPLGAAARGAGADGTDVSKSLIALRRTVEDLDPSRHGDLLAPKRLFGLLPFGSRLRDYFARYQSSQGHLNAIVKSLQGGQAELERDNADIEQEKANLWALMGRLRQYIYLGQRLDTALASRIDAIETTDADRARVLREDLLFPVRQRVQDLLTQLAVGVQGYLALDLIRRNNGELIKGVDRATTTTVSALRTAIIVAQALVDQKLVLDQITVLNTTTGRLIESTSEMLRQQSGAINEQAASSTIELAKLQAAFDNIYAAIDEVDAFKIKALDSMSKTIDALSAEVSKSHAQLERAAARDASADGTDANPDARQATPEITAS